jgi:hypothetical protein
LNRKSVGYFEGTDSRLLTGLVCDGHDTIPISNGLDNHGKHIRSVHEGSRLDLLVGYLHKIFAPQGAATTYQDIFHVCRVYEMPFLLEVPEDFHGRAEEMIGGSVPDIVTLVDPKQALDVAREILKG